MDIGGYVAYRYRKKYCLDLKARLSWKHDWYYLFRKIQENLF